jgi:hypothetical protein
MAFEDFLVRKIDRTRKAEALDKGATYLARAEGRAKALLQKPEYTIQAPDFFDLYQKEAVMRDMWDVKRKKDAIKKSDSPEMAENARLAEVFEAITLEHAELSNWLGEDVTMLKTSLYDDYFNGVDLLAEWQKEGAEPHALALAVDVTFGVRTVERKLNQIRRDIDEGKLGRIKYFRNASGTYRGERSDAAKVVIGVSKGAVHALARLWADNDKKALGTHPIQRVLVEEIDTQLRAMQRYAQSRGRGTVADAYGRSLSIIGKVRDQKKNIAYGDLENNPVFNEIREQTEAVFKV